MIASVLYTFTPNIQSIAAAQSSGSTFGSTSIGNSVIGTGSGAAKTAGYFQLTTSGTVTKITAYIAAYGSGSGYAKAAIYSDSNGQPNLPVGGVTVQVSVPATAGWVDFTYTTPVHLTAGYYWITLIDNSGCNWYYNTGGVSAWKWISYANEPTSPFGTCTTRTDLISIYATYTADSQSSGSSQSIQKACIANCMTWNGVMNDPQAFAFAQAHFNAMDIGGYEWQNYPVSAIQGFKNAGMTTLGYQRFAEVEYSPTPAYCSADWTVCNANEAWFIHDAATGSRIWDPTVNGFLMNIGNAGFRAHWIAYVASNLNSYPGLTGIFIDNTIGSMNPNWIPWVDYTGGGTPVFTSSDLNNWHSNAVSLLGQIKAAFPNYTIIINTDGIYSDYGAQVDGVMIEGFVHATYQTADDTSNNAINQINYFSSITSSGKIAWYCSGTSSGTTSQVNNIVEYCLCGALISNNNPKSVFSFNNWFSFDGSYGYYPIMDTNIGSPTDAYYQSQNIYMRDYTGGLVLFNPSANSYTINLAQNYILNGATVSSVTISPYSGEILSS